MKAMLRWQKHITQCIRISMNHTKRIKLPLKNAVKMISQLQKKNGICFTKIIKRIMILKKYSII